MELTLDQTLQKGIEAYKAGQIEDADHLYTAILNVQPEHPEANHNMGVLTVNANKAQDALPFFKRALESDPSISQHWLSYIDALIQLHQLADAQSVLDQAKDLGAKGDAFEHFEQVLNAQYAAPINASLDKSDQSQERANVLDSLKLDQALRLAKKKVKEGAHENANRVYLDILAKYPKNKQAKEGIKSLSGRLINKPSKAQEPTQDQQKELVNLYQQGQFQQALNSAQKLLPQFPNSLALYNIQGAANAGLGQFDAAIENYKQALKIKPDYADSHNNMGAALQNKNDFKAAISCYRQALKIKPDYAEAYNNMGVALKDEGDLETALESYTKAIKIRPDYAEAYNNKGILLQDKGDLNGAIESYKKALNINPNYAEAYNNMGSAFNSKGKLEAALENHKKALKIKPDYAEAYNNMGVALKGQGDLEAALANFSKAIKFRPDYAEAYTNLGGTLHDKGDLKPAIDSYKKALKINPNYAEAHYNLGKLLLESHHYEQAAHHFKLSDFEKSKHYLLRCLYLQDKRSLFYDHLDDLIDQGEIHPMIGSLSCRAELNYGIERPNLFCKNPLNYVSKIDLSDQYDFGKIFVKTSRIILNDNRILKKRQELLTNGMQTAGNIFSLEPNLTKDIENTIRLEIDKYQTNYRDSKEGLITHWPRDYSLFGWLVSMTSGGQLQPHMHESGWISGSIYINVPEKSKVDSGNLVVCIEEQQLAGAHKGQEKSIDVVTGSLCLFPASLLHYTIPFESNEERIVLAFDVVPK
jgi:tetratricopeptide (TPR) repeat protein